VFCQGRRGFYASVVKPRKISNIKHLSALLKPACKIRLQGAYKFREPIEKNDRLRRRSLGLLCAGFWRSYQHNGKLKTTLIRGNTVVPRDAKRRSPLPSGRSSRAPANVPTGRQLSICCGSNHRAFDRYARLTFRDRFRFTSTVA
jgi:hypothetical protein